VFKKLTAEPLFQAALLIDKRNEENTMNHKMIRIIALILAILLVGGVFAGVLSSVAFAADPSCLQIF